MAKRFALVAAAGEEGIRARIFPWASGEAKTAVARCFEDWLKSRGGLEPAEIRNGIAMVRAFIERHAARFADWDAPNTPVRDCAGFKRRDNSGTTFLFFPAAFREACEGLDHTLIARALAQRGMLMPESDFKFTKPVRLPPGKEVHRVYWVSPSIFGGAASDASTDM